MPSFKLGLKGLACFLDLFISFRFKQLKEEEARRKQQKEAEKTKEISLKNEAERGDMKVEHQLDTNSTKSLNGDPSSSNSNKFEQPLISKMEDVEDSVRYSTTRDQQNLNDNLEKVVYRTMHQFLKYRR